MSNRNKILKINLSNLNIKKKTEKLISVYIFAINRLNPLKDYASKVRGFEIIDVFKTA